MYTLRSCSKVVCVYTSVVDALAWPNSLLTLSILAPLLSIAVAKECRNTCGESFFCVLTSDSLAFTRSLTS